MRSISNLGPIFKIAGLVIAAIGLVFLIGQVIVPAFGGSPMIGGPQGDDKIAESTATPNPTPKPTPNPTPIAKPDMSDSATELDSGYLSVNDPYMHGSEMIFTSGDPTSDTPNNDRVVVYDKAADTAAAVEGVEMKYFALFEPKINENFIVYLDVKAKDGGAVCGYDRTKNEMFVMREYLFGKPKVTLVGDYALWMQQTGKGTDKLYLYHLPSKDCVTLEVFINTPLSVSGAHMSGDAIVYVQPQGESKVLDRSSMSTNSEIVVVPLEDGGDTKAVTFEPGMYVYDPKIDGDYIVFIDQPRSEASRLMVCEKQGDTYSEPEVIAEGIMNYDVGEGYVVYTSEDVVYIYYFADGSSGKLSSTESARSLLASANGKNVLWYDITDMESKASVIRYIQVP